MDKCLAFCQALVGGNHKFSFTLTIGKDIFSYTTNDQRREASAGQGSDLKKAAPLKQNRRWKRAADPAVKLRKAAHDAAARAEEAAAGAVQGPTAQSEMGWVAGPACATAEEAKREPCCRKCKRPVASHPGGTRGCGASCTNTVLTPEKLLHQSKGKPRTLTPVRGEGREEVDVNNDTAVEVRWMVKK